MVALSLPPPAATTAEGEVLHTLLIHSSAAKVLREHVNGPWAAGMYPGQGQSRRRRLEITCSEACVADLGISPKKRKRRELDI